MNSHREELLELRQEFNKFDKKDPDAIRKWFADNPYYSTADHAQIAGMSRGYIRKLRKLANLTKKAPPNLPFYKPTGVIVSIEIPEDWDNKEWLEKAVKLYTVRRLAAAIGVSNHLIHNRLVRYGIPYDTTIRSKNPHFSYAWVYEHYVEQGLNQTQCAKLAGISKENFATWLVKLEIPVRWAGQKGAINTILWFDKLAYQLSQLPITRTIVQRPDHIHVRFMHYIWESYFPNKTGPRRRMSYHITREHARLEKIPSVIYQYESEADGTNYYPQHIQINMAEWQQASFMERRVAIHIFGKKVFDNKYMQLEHPIPVISRDLEILKTTNYNLFATKIGFTAYNKISGLRFTPGKKIIEHFFDMSCLWERTLSSPRYITYVLNYLAETPLIFNTHNMVSIVLSRITAIARHKQYIPRIPTPLVYAAILSKLGITGPVLDLYPNYGERAIACALLGIPYISRPNIIFDKAVERGFAEFIGLQHQIYDGSKAALLFCDGGLTMPELDDIAELSKSAANMLLYVPARKRLLIQSKLPPKSVIPIKSSYFSKIHDYLFLY